MGECSRKPVSSRGGEKRMLCRISFFFFFSPRLTSSCDVYRPCYHRWWPRSDYGKRSYDSHPFLLLTRRVFIARDSGKAGFSWVWACWDSVWHAYSDFPGSRLPGPHRQFILPSGWTGRLSSRGCFVTAPSTSYQLSSHSSSPHSLPPPGFPIHTQGCPGAAHLPSGIICCLFCRLEHDFLTFLSVVGKGGFQRPLRGRNWFPRAHAGQKLLA